jgi:hypothetical protein
MIVEQQTATTSVNTSHSHSEKDKSGSQQPSFDSKGGQKKALEPGIQKFFRKYRQKVGTTFIVDLKAMTEMFAEIEE